MPNSILNAIKIQSKVVIPIVRELKKEIGKGVRMSLSVAPLPARMSIIGSVGVSRRTPILGLNKKGKTHSRSSAR